jgi:hypothetical protein
MGYARCLAGIIREGRLLRPSDELNAGPRFDDGSSLQGRGYDEGDAPE